MTKHVLFLAAWMGGLFNASAQTTCGTAMEITPGLWTVSTIVPSEIPLPTCALNGTLNTTGSVWFSYTPPQDTSITVTSYLPGFPTVDTRVHVYAGPCEERVCVGGDDDSGLGATSIATLDVLGGVTYLIAWDNRWSSSGFTFQLIENEPPPPPLENQVTFTNGVVPVGGTYVICIVDMDGDGLDDAVGVSSNMVNIAYQQPGGTYNSVGVPTPGAMFMPTWSMCAGDLDGNGRTDLLYGSGQGVSFMFANDEGTAFTQQAGPEYVFSQRSNMVDINNDGHLDAFVCHDVAPNVYYLNNGSGFLTFTQGGIGPNGGNYGSIWTDYDNDGDQDCFIAKCGSSPPDVFMRNNGDGSFTDVAGMYGMGDWHQSWSSAWGDYDNDGDMDVLIGDNGSGYQKLLRNDMPGFTDVTSGAGIFGQSRDWVTHDFDNNGYLDILGGYSLWLNQGDMTFTQNATAGPGMGAVGDLNNDGFLDILLGGASFNDGNDNNWIKVVTKGVVSNPNGIGARVMVTSALGTQIREIRSGDGFEFMSSLTAHFGLGEDEEIEEVVVRWPSGIVDVIPAPEINGTLTVVEGVSTGLDEHSTDSGLTLFPNPAVDVMMVSGAEGLANVPVRILDATGKLVLTRTLRNGQLNVSDLTSGVYLMLVTTGDGVLQKRFTKQ